MMTLLLLPGVLIVMILVYLIIIILSPWIQVKKQPLSSGTPSNRVRNCRQDVSFKVEGTLLSAWLYLPEDLAEPKACLVLNHGFCGTKDMILEKYALRFVKAGYATLTFDYRHFGDSEGEPRQLYSVSRQLADAKAAIAYARSRKEIDARRIYTWGTSSSGNYGLLLASEDQKIAGIIGQSPSFDHQADGKMILKRDGLTWFLKLIKHAQRDKGRSRLGLSEHRFPVVGKPGTTAMFIAPGSYEGYEKLARFSKTFKNEVCARLMFDSHGPDLLKAAEKVRCPVLFQVCKYDKITAPDSHHKITKVLKDKVEFVSYPIGHFDIYFGEYFDKSVQRQIEFLERQENKLLSYRI